MLGALKVPVSWTELARRTAREIAADNCLGLAAQLAFYFFLALFPALLFLVAIVSYLPIQNVMDAITGALARVAPLEVMDLIKTQLVKIASDKSGGLLTLGMIGTLWSTSSGVSAIIDTLNQAYDIQETRPLWKTKLIALALTIALAAFIVCSFALVLVGPALAEKIAAWFYLGSAFTWTWKIAQWPVVFALVSFGVAIVYYYAPDAEQDWIWITPGSIFATILWLIVSLAFRVYVTRFGSYNATYGAIGGIIVTMLWFYVSSLAVLVGAELNAEIEHASPYGKDPGEKSPREKKKIGAAAERAWSYARAAGTLKPAVARENCDVDADLPLADAAPTPPPRPSDWLIGAAALVPVAAIACAKLNARFRKIAG